MSTRPNLDELTRRERQVMNIIYRLGKATAVEVESELRDEPANATVRTILRVLENKGYLRHETVKGQFVYRPTIASARVRKGMLMQLMDTFFGGAEGSAVISILKKAQARLSETEREEILRLIEQSREQGK